ncbi:hypothetical protein [Nonomuraea sp. NPDC049480]|uniref:hypothetical protein n=1 Tax=Nonomuraea sp. NPDC049480 TaxID=3364353 RepID=UPI00379BF76D
MPDLVAEVTEPGCSASPRIWSACVLPYIEITDLRRTGFRTVAAPPSCSNVAAAWESS